MPRKQQTQAEVVLHYFRTADMTEAALVLRLAAGEFKSRQPKAAAKPATASSAGQAATPRTRKPRTQTNVSAGAVALPGMQETVG